MNVSIPNVRCRNPRGVLSTLLSTTKAFTLIELLVVIGILAVLIALIFPVFQKTKGAAGRTKLISNMKTIAAGIHLVTAENGRFPAYYGSTGFGSWWQNVVAPYVGEPPLVLSAEAMTPAAIRRSIFNDPTDKSITIPVYGSRPTRNIAINGQLSLPDDLGAYPDGNGATYRIPVSIAHPAKLLLLSPGCLASTSTEFGGGSYILPLYVRSLSATEYSRGMKDLPVAFADGHIETVSTDFFQKEADKDWNSQLFDPSAINPEP